MLLANQFSKSIYFACQGSKMCGTFACSQKEAGLSAAHVSGSATAKTLLCTPYFFAFLLPQLSVRGAV
jgi:hypothetical protein